MRRLASLIFAGWLLLAGNAGAQAAPSTRSLLAEARQLAGIYGERIWPGMSGAPFSVLLLYPGHDVLSCASAASADFTELPQLHGAQCNEWIRSAGSLPRSTQASLFLQGIPGPVMVSGTPRETAASPGSWILTALHEHFHQMQMARPGYQQGVQALGLANGDETGMWMLNFPFAYDDQQSGLALQAMAHDLTAILQEPDPGMRRMLEIAYAKARPDRMAQLADADRKYAELQLWQEGVARYTELRFAEYGAVAQTQGWQSPIDYAALEMNLRDNLLRQLRTARLPTDKRDLFYPLGAAEALILDDLDPVWHERYFGGHYSMAPLFATALNPSRP